MTPRRVGLALSLGLGVVLWAAGCATRQVVGGSGDAAGRLAAAERRLDVLEVRQQELEGNAWDMGRLRERVERVDPPRVEQGRAAARGPAGHGGPTVADIQRALQRAGYYDGPVDGTAGPRTTRAIKAFQRARGLSVDGKVGPKTWAALSPYRSSSDTHGGSR